MGAIPRPTRDFCPTRDDRFYRPETHGRYLGEPVPMAVSREYNILDVLRTFKLKEQKLGK